MYAEKVYFSLWFWMLSTMVGSVAFGPVMRQYIMASRLGNTVYIRPGLKFCGEETEVPIAPLHKHP